MESARSYPELIRMAREAEESEDTEKAIAFYEKALKQDSLQELPYRRLMIIYRREQRLADELRIIKKGIVAFENLYRDRKDLALRGNRKTIRISSELAKSLGQADSRGRQTVHPEPLSSWNKRMEAVQKKMERKKKRVKKGR